MKKIILTVALLFSLPCVAETDTVRVCGRPTSGGTLFQYDSIQDMFISQFYCNAIGGEIQNAYQSGGLYLCAEYSSLVTSSNGTNEYRNCKIITDTLKCAANAYYIPSSKSCSRCPTGYFAKIPSIASGQTNYLQDVHQNTSCSICATGYYKSGSDCLKCPDSGTSDIYDASITDCYITRGSDDTGTYTFSPECHWTN